MVTQKIKLGAEELRLLFTLEEEGRNVFSTADARRILASSDAAVWNVIYRLKKKKRIEEIERGKYLLIPARAGYDAAWSEVSFFIVSHVINPYYVSFWTALHYWGMTEQAPAVVFVATPKRRRDLNYGNTRFEFITLAEKKFFGFVEEKTASGRFYISSREKTVVDCLMYPKYCGGLDEALKGIWKAKKELDFVKLVEYSKKTGTDVVSRRVFYALDMLGLLDRKLSKTAPAAPRGYMWLDPLGPKKAIGYSKRYGLMINRTRDELTSWMRY